MNKRLIRNFPPGYDHTKEIRTVFLTNSILIILMTISFLLSIINERHLLYIRVGPDMILNTSKLMPDFVQILGNRLRFFPSLAMLAFVSAVISHYIYYYGESKSIYLMRRLPNKLELHRRCLLMPLIYALVFLITAIILLLIYYLTYMKLTPEACLSPNQWEKIWRVLN